MAFGKIGLNMAAIVYFLVDIVVSIFEKLIKPRNAAIIVGLSTTTIATIHIYADLGRNSGFICRSLNIFNDSCTYYCT
jgi:predicted PurR-regulated permease PerM